MRGGPKSFTCAPRYLKPPFRTYEYWSFRKIFVIRCILPIQILSYYSILSSSADGSLLAWGENRFGQCGVDPDAARICTPTRVEMPAEVGRIVRVAAGWTHSLALTGSRPSSLNVWFQIWYLPIYSFDLPIDTGAIVSWGRANYGQLGRPAHSADSGGLAASSSSTAGAASAASGAHSGPRYDHRPARVPSLPRCVHVASGSEHSLALTGAQYSSLITAFRLHSFSCLTMIYHFFASAAPWTRTVHQPVE